MLSWLVGMGFNLIQHILQRAGSSGNNAGHLLLVGRGRCGGPVGTAAARRKPTNLEADADLHGPADKVVHHCQEGSPDALIIIRKCANHKDLRE